MLDEGIVLDDRACRERVHPKQQGGSTGQREYSERVPSADSLGREEVTVTLPQTLGLVLVTLCEL